MKTTLNLDEQLYRRAKSEAALRGISVGRMIEMALEEVLNRPQADELPLGKWLATLPRLPSDVVKELQRNLEEDESRKIDPEMWN